jgi:hypothetical protein
MTQETPRFERFLEQAARAVSGAELHPISVLQRVQAAAEGEIRGDAIPNRYRIEVGPADYQSLRRIEQSLIAGVARMLDEIASQRELTKLAAWDIALAERELLAPGNVRVAAAFAEPAHREIAAQETLDRRTQVITRVRGTTLALSDGTRVRVLHTPFVIGRAPGCDLVVADLSISRRHAVIRSDAAGPLVLHDLDSRNGVVVEGKRVPELALQPGVRFALGDQAFTVEADA